MKFFTSYYGNIKNIPEDYILVSISGGITDEIEAVVDLHDKRLAPKKQFFLEYKDSPQGSKRELVYTKEFQRLVIDEVDMNDIFKSWSDLFGKDKKYVILCYESPENTFCHRHLVAEAIEEKYSIDIPEIGVDTEIYERKNGKMDCKIKFDVEEW